MAYFRTIMAYIEPAGYDVSTSFTQLNDNSVHICPSLEMLAMYATRRLANFSHLHAFHGHDTRSDSSVAPFSHQ